jgi:hypothetical protein
MYINRVTVLVVSWGMQKPFPQCLAPWPDNSWPTSQLQLDRPVMTDANGLRRGRKVRTRLPNGVDVRPVEVTCAVPAPAPDVLGPGGKVQRVALLLDKQPVVRSEPRAVLRVRTRIFGQAAETGVPADGGQVSPRRVDDVEHLLRRESVHQNQGVIAEART